MSTVTVVANKELSAGGLRFSALARDVATMSGGTLLNVVFSTALVFLIPRMVSVEDYGYWRLFTLYAGYVGFLHFGFADGALLRWAGRPLEEFRHEVAPSVKFLFWQHLAVAIPLGAVLALAVPRSFYLVVIAVLIFALIANSVTLLQNNLQGARLFGPLAVATAAPVGVFLTLTFLLNLRKAPNSRELISLYCVAWAAVLVYLWFRVRPEPSSSWEPVWSIGKACTLLGWPILLANGGFALVQSADRLIVSSALPIYDFAQYSLAASTMFVPATAIAAVYRVFFSHVAGIEPGSRGKVYGRVSKFLLVLWSLLLPYYFVLAAFLPRFLPRYEPSLPIARILLLGAIFLANIQILQMSYSYLHGMGRQFLLQAGGALAVSSSLALVLTLWLRSLVAVAIGQVAVLALWWLMNEWSLRESTGQGWREWLRVWVVFLLSSIGYELALWSSRGIGWQLLIFYPVVCCILSIFCPEELRLGWKLAAHASSTEVPKQVGAP